MRESLQPQVVIAEYDASWPAIFATEHDRVRGIAAPAIHAIHHVGSTSVPGLAAKPIIDVLVLLRRFLTDEEIAAIAAPGYRFVWDEDIQRQYFSRRVVDRGFHVHCYLVDSPEARDLLRFRDYLRAHIETAREYEALKRQLAHKYRFDRSIYQDAKTDFVRAVNQKAIEEGAGARFIV